MSFAGFVFDMIRRNKEDREALERIRERSKDAAKNYKSSLPDITPEEQGEIMLQTKEREEQEQKYHFRATLLIFGIAFITALLLWLILD